MNLMSMLGLNILRSYIANLDRTYILVLFKTASSRQVSVLRDAIWKHIAFQISIRAKIPVSISFRAHNIDHSLIPIFQFIVAQSISNVPARTTPSVLRLERRPS